ncbi:hypothetical protein MASR1M74_26200 [Lentimicrobium sp.]
MHGVFKRHGDDIGGHGANLYLFGSSFVVLNLTITNSKISDSEKHNVNLPSVDESTDMTH